jgi:hypothetical protein
MTWTRSIFMETRVRLFLRMFTERGVGVKHTGRPSSQCARRLALIFQADYDLTTLH